jgi:hypothetical protein
MFTSRSPQKNKRSLPIGWERRTSNNIDPSRVYYTNGRQSQWNFPEPIFKREDSSFFAPKRDPSFSSPWLANQYRSPEVRAANRAWEDQIDDWARQHDPNPSFSSPWLANQYTSPEVRRANRAWEDESSPEVRAANDAEMDELARRQHDPNPSFSSPWLANVYDGARQHHTTPRMRDAEMDELARETQRRVEQLLFRSEQERERRNETPAQRQNRLDFEQIKAQRDELYNDRVRVALEIERHKRNGTTSDDSYHDALRERDRLEKVDDYLTQSLLFYKQNHPHLF